MPLLYNSGMLRERHGRSQMDISSSLDKILHFWVGIVLGMGVVAVLNRYAYRGMRQINLVCYLNMLVWGASGLFFYRKIGIPLLSHQAFYMAIPDWDIPLYHLTRLRFLIHRSWLFHSNIIPIGLLVLFLYLATKPGIRGDRWGTRLVKWGRDGAIGLSVGVSAHLLWDALLSSTRQGFQIHSWSVFHSYLWLFLNLLLGIGVPVLFIILLDANATAQFNRAIAPDRDE